MYPEVPFDGISWPITQHAGVLSERSLDGLLRACLLCHGETVNPERINGYLVKNGILTANVRSDSNRIDAWRDYQQILSEFGLLYSTRISKVIRLTPVAMAYLNGNLTYGELITLQILRYQYPNGHKTQLSPSLVQSLGEQFSYETFSELQAACNILLRPAVLVWQVQNRLWDKGQPAFLTLDEMQRYLVRCSRHSDTEYAVSAIIDSRVRNTELPALSRARRNMSDWMKLLGQTLLFKTSADGASIAMSAYSIRHRQQVASICNALAKPDSFWILPDSDIKQSWFDTYGNYDENIRYITKE